MARARTTDGPRERQRQPPSRRHAPPEEALRQRDAVLQAVASSAERLLRAVAWDEAVEDVLRELGEAAQVSRAYLFRAREADGDVVVSQVEEWSSNGVTSQIDNPSLQAFALSASGFGRWRIELESGRAIHGDVEAFPEPERATLRAQGIRSIVIVPVLTDALYGFLGFDQCDHEREWLPSEIEALRTAAGILAAAIQRSHAEAGRVAAETRYRALVDSLPLITYVDAIDDEMTPLYISPQIEPLLGYSLQEWLHVPGLFGRIVHPDDRQHALESEWPDTDGPHRMEYRVTARDGRVVWFLDEHVIVRDEAGRRLHAQGYMLDITEQKRIEGELRRANEMLNALVQSSPLAIIVTDRSDRITLWNSAAERIYGWTAEETVGRQPPTRPPGREPEYRMFLEASQRGEAIDGFETRRLHRSGSPIDVSISLAPLHNADGELVGMLGVHADVTDRKTLEAQVMQSQRLETVGRLAGGIAHDFNNLLTAISGYAEFLLDGLGEDQPLRRDAVEIKRAADVAAALVRQLLAFSRRQMVQPRTVDLNVVVRDAESLLRRLIGEDVLLETVLSPLLPPVHADPAQLEQIILNLAVNARDAMPDGGRLSVRTGAADDGRAVTLTVVDTGFGMDDETRLHAFEPFFTTKEPGKGTGLGLATVYGIVTQTGGTVEVESEPGRGATFRIQLPALVSVGDVGRTAEPDDFGRPDSATVLLVEDEPVVRELAARVLASAGYTVIEAPGGAEALLLADRHEGTIDLLLTDVVMPGMSGRELAERLGRARPGMRVLFTSGYTDDEVWQSESDGGFVGKPFSPAILQAKVREALGAHR